MTPDEFRAILAQRSADAVVDDLILTDDPGPYLSRDALEFLIGKARSAFDIPNDHTVDAIVVGSAKLGFAMLEKPPKEGRPYKPAYRPYEPGASDIDVAVVSPVLYGKLWQELARFGANQIWFPWRTMLSGYMLHGWIRPDKFPPNPPQRCLDWKQVVNDASRSTHFRYKRLRCGIYQSKYFLKLYQMRGVRAAQAVEMSQ